MNLLTICVFLLGVGFAPVSSFLVSSPTSCEYYDAACVEKAAASNGAQDVSQVHVQRQSNMFLFSVFVSEYFLSEETQKKSF